MFFYIILAIFAIVIFAMLAFMNAVMDVREDHKWDREIRREKKEGKNI